MMFQELIITFYSICLVFVSSDSKFRFANHYADHMVLQRAPQRAVLWGYGEVGASVDIVVTNIREFKVHDYHISVYQDSRGDGVWRVTLNLYSAGGPYDITATSYIESDILSIQLRDVLFGDIWLCSGQSNMQFPLSHSMKAAAEIALAPRYHDVRLFQVVRYFSNITVPELEVDKIALQWSLPTISNTPGYAALCWMFGRRLYDQYGVPIGLISSNYGGTRVEAWSSPDMLVECGVENIQKNDQNSKSALWNAMIYPLLNTTIFGVIWYQGENNCDKPATYNCTFPAMIAGWRKQWHESTGGNTDPMFPFGFVQIAIIGLDYPRPNFPIIRWKQTAEYGYVPNPKQPRTFMAVAMDLPDNVSPFLTIHPRYKTDLADRLILGARDIAYSENTYWTGPIFDNVTVYALSEDYSIVKVSYKQSSLLSGGIEVRTIHGFEVKLDHTADWTAVNITSHKKNQLNLMVRKEESKIITAVRYAWKQEPCLLKFCAAYGIGTELPSPPFVTYGPFQAEEQPIKF